MWLNNTNRRTRPIVGALPLKANQLEPLVVKLETSNWTQLEKCPLTPKFKFRSKTKERSWMWVSLASFTVVDSVRVASRLPGVSMKNVVDCHISLSNNDDDDDDDGVVVYHSYSHPTMWIMDFFDATWSTTAAHKYHIVCFYDSWLLLIIYRKYVMVGKKLQPLQRPGFHSL